MMFSPMIDLLVRAAILLIAAWLTAAVARRRSASLRALIWTSDLSSTRGCRLAGGATPSLTQRFITTRSARIDQR